MKIENDANLDMKKETPKVQNYRNWNCYRFFCEIEMKDLTESI